MRPSMATRSALRGATHGMGDDARRAGAMLWSGIREPRPSARRLACGAVLLRYFVAAAGDYRQFPITSRRVRTVASSSRMGSDLCSVQFGSREHQIAAALRERG